MGWADARAELVTLLGTVAITAPIAQTIKKVYEFPPGTVQDKPCFILYPPAITTERNMGGLRIDRVRARIALVIQDADKDRAAQLVSAYVDQLGALIDANVTLNGKVTVVMGQETEEGSAITIGGIEYQGCITILTLETKLSVTYDL